VDPIFLFSIDLEDIRSMFEGGHRFEERVPLNTGRYLDFLERHGMRCTFFTVGDVARRHPELIREIVARGHEIASHSSDHVTLDRHDPASFRDDVLRCLDDLARAGAERVAGFRAPAASLTAETAWAYDVLAELGFTYSSSVIAARTPTYGWSEFGPDRPSKRFGIWELPISLTRFPLLNLPFCGGVFFRVLPFALVRQLFVSRLRRGEPVLGYFHPYDIDDQQERFMHPQIGGSRLYNWLMYRNRHAVLERLEALTANGVVGIPYAEYVERVLEPNAPRRADV
jgi:peptidoglycan-N-acetylglucosamine deacetylase